MQMEDNEMLHILTFERDSHWGIWTWCKYDSAPTVLINWESELIVNVNEMKQVEQAGTLVEH
jgi:hypothetical protein